MRWIRLSEVEFLQNPFRIEVDRSTYTLTVFSAGALHEQYRVALGAGDTPTPVGRFFLEQLVAVSDPNGAYGPFAFGLSGFSETIDNFNGGPGIIGIHGTNAPEALGTNVSHGCIRLENDAITELASYLPLATPVDII